MIRVCEHCSNVDIEELKSQIGEDKLQFGCIENCAAYKTEAYGYVNDELIVEKNSTDWIEKVSKL